MNKIVFTGDYKELKKLGFQFRKTHEQHLIYYKNKEVYVWKSGNEVEMGDCHGHDAIFLAYFIQHNFSISNPFNQLILNTKTLQVEEYDFKTHDAVFLSMQGIITEEEIHETYETYSKKRIDEATLSTLQDLYEKNWISIVPDTELCTT